MLMIWVILKYKLTKIRRKTYHSAQKEDLRKNFKSLLHWAAYCSSHTLIETHLHLSSKMRTQVLSDITCVSLGQQSAVPHVLKEVTSSSKVQRSTEDLALDSFKIYGITHQRHRVTSRRQEHSETLLWDLIPHMVRWCHSIRVWNGRLRRRQ